MLVFCKKNHHLNLAQVICGSLNLFTYFIYTPQYSLVPIEHQHYSEFEPLKHFIKTWHKKCDSHLVGRESIFFLTFSPFSFQFFFSLYF